MCRDEDFPPYDDLTPEEQAARIRAKTRKPTRIVVSGDPKVFRVRAANTRTAPRAPHAHLDESQQFRALVLEGIAYVLTVALVIWLLFAMSGQRVV